MLSSFRLKQLQVTLLQILLILMVWGFAYTIQKFLHLPIVSGVLGFFILLFLLETQWIRLEQVEHGANLLLTELLLFFIPPVVGVIQYQQLLMSSGWKIVIIIFISFRCLFYDGKDTAFFWKYQTFLSFSFSGY